MKITTHDHSIMMAAHYAALDNQQLEKDDADKAKQALTAIGSIADAHADRKAAIMGDGNLSSTGRDAAVRALVGTSDAQLNKIVAPVVEHFQGKVHESAKAAAAAATFEPTMADHLKAIEVRQIAAGIDPLMLAARLHTLAMDGTDDHAVHSILNASSLKPLVSPAAAERARAMMAARKAPTHTADGEKAADTLATLNLAHRTALHSFANPAERARLGIDNISVAASAVSIPRADAPGA